MEQIDVMIRTIKDYPEKGMTYPDISPLIMHPVGFRMVVDALIERYSKPDIVVDAVAGIESRGHIIGGALAYGLGKKFVPLRKRGKIPAEVVT